jgi:hypothetical protein
MYGWPPIHSAEFVFQLDDVERAADRGVEGLQIALRYELVANA